MSVKVICLTADHQARLEDETFHELACIDKQDSLKFGFLINGLTSAEIVLDEKTS